MQKAAPQHRPPRSAPGPRRPAGASLQAPLAASAAPLVALAHAGTPAGPVAQCMAAPGQPRTGGLPDGLRQAVEALSGQPLDAVQVHYNSPQPARAQALAFAQGGAIHLAPGQERHLPHEAWHLVQQAQGRVRPTWQHPAGMPINSEAALEREADRMGALAMQRSSGSTGSGSDSSSTGSGSALPRATPGLHGAAAPPSAAPSGAVLQRTEESAALLTKLAVPQIKPGPTVEVQKALVEKLDASQDFDGDILNLGGILLDALPDLDSALLQTAQLVNLPNHLRGFVSAGRPRAKAIIDQGLAPMVVQNTLSTMIDAQQIAYLRLAGLPNADWKILVEVHYYRERDMTQTGMHKDSRGETLFVNLNYHMDRTVVAPEFVVNPAPSQTHDDHTAQTLPPVFNQDIAVARQRLPAPSSYDTGIAQPYSYVAFVDEAMHHATPYYNHRWVTGADVDAFLLSRYGATWQHAKTKHAAHQQRGWFFRNYDFASYLDTQIIPATDIALWQTRLDLVADPERKITRLDLNGAITDTDFDEVLALAADNGTVRTGGASLGYQQVSIPTTISGQPGFTAPVQTARPTLTRKLSNPDFRKTLPPQPAEKEKRAFFRTWVRAIPEAQAEKLRG